ncbi:MAG TPA: Dabb family protein [Candidatus Saccharimonadales bacterium]|nr:Dabb family protein [Candidatus Saccharimonadales bacterium]
MDYSKSRPIRHIVLFKVYENTSNEDRQKAIETLKKLGSEPGVLEWRIEESLDTRKGYVIAENSLFEDNNKFQQFRASQNHKVAVEVMSKIADWTVADYAE